MNFPMEPNSPVAMTPVRHSAYAMLPECIRQYYSEREYLCLSENEKANLQQTETEPEW